MSLILPDTLHQRLMLASQHEETSVSELVRVLLDRGLRFQEKSQTEKMYEALKELEGIGDTSITDASTTVDETLYGERGVWRGESTESGLWEMSFSKNTK